MLIDHGKKIGIPSHTVQGMFSQVHTAWSRCFKKTGDKLRLKGTRNKLNSTHFSDLIRAPEGNYVKLPGIRKLKFHKQAIPVDKIKCGCIITKRTSDWYLLFVSIDAERQAISRTGNIGIIDIDLGFKDLLTASSEEKITYPQELRFCEKRLAQAQRGINRRLVEKLYEHLKSQRRGRNHKLSLRLVQHNSTIYFSKDNTKGIAQTFGKSVAKSMASSKHSQLRSMFEYKNRTGDTQYAEVEPRNSTRTCSACGGLPGLTGLAGLSVG